VEATPVAVGISPKILLTSLIQIKTKTILPFFFLAGLIISNAF
jgi:hypothetical protein